MSVLSKYDRISLIYDMMEAPVELFLFRKWRRAVLSDMHGSVLEVGTGTGKNLDYYPKDCKITAIDISPKMLKHAKKRMVGWIIFHFRLWTQKNSHLLTIVSIT